MYKHPAKRSGSWPSWRRLCEKALFALLLSAATAATPASAQVQMSAFGYGYAPTSTAAYDIAYAEANSALINECPGYVSDRYVIWYNVIWNGMTWVSQVQLGGYCN